MKNNTTGLFSSHYNLTNFSIHIHSFSSNFVNRLNLSSLYSLQIFAFCHEMKYRIRFDLDDIVCMMFADVIDIEYGIWSVCQTRQSYDFKRLGKKCMF